MILVNTGPIVALFDPAGGSHAACLAVLQQIDEPLGTTTPVLIEAFHLLTPGSIGGDNLIQFIAEGGLIIWYFDAETLSRAFDLMHQYADHPMDLTDASLVVMAETGKLRKIFTIDRTDFAAYRIRRGHRHDAFELLAPAR